jgi:Cu2+-exporting ATPase
LDRASNIDKVVFDKTGTVTSGSMRLADQSALQKLQARDRQALFELCARSTHPTSVVIADALRAYDLKISDDTQSASIIEELPGAGLRSLSEADGEYRLGKSGWAEGGDSAGASAGGTTVFAHQGEVLARFALREEARPDVFDEVHALQREGFEVFLLSGDSEARVRELADALGLPSQHAFAERSPEDKQAWLREHDQGDLLFVGDGINDSLAAQAATCSGTPALDRPFMASHCDFYLSTDRIEPIRSALRYAKRLAQVVRRNLAFALAYNIVAISLAWAGWMSPWLAAILMPACSIFIVLGTTFSLSTRSLAWKS